MQLTSNEAGITQPFSSRLPVMLYDIFRMAVSVKKKRVISVCRLQTINELDSGVLQDAAQQVLKY